VWGGGGGGGGGNPIIKRQFSLCKAEVKQESKRKSKKGL